MLEETGYRHIYVTVDTPSDITSLARSLNIHTQQEVALNQSNLVAVAVPTSQLISDAGTFIIQPAGISVSAETTTSTDEEKLIYTETSSAEPAVSDIVPETEESQGLLSSSPCGQRSTQVTDTQVADTVEREAVSFRVIRSQLKPEDIDSKKPYVVRETAPVPLVVCRCDIRKNNVKTEQPIFTNVQANLASQLLDMIPGCTSTFLHQFVTQHDMRLHEELATPGNLQVSGELHKLLCLHDNLSQLVSASTQHTEGVTVQTPDPGMPIVKDKGVICDLIQPQYSRSGRLIKRRNLDHPMDKEQEGSVSGVSVSVETLTPILVPVQRMQQTGKRKRGRPPKNPKLFQISVREEINNDEGGTQLEPFAEVANVMAESTIEETNLPVSTVPAEKDRLLLPVTSTQQCVTSTNDIPTIQTEIEGQTVLLEDPGVVLSEQVGVEHIRAMQETHIGNDPVEGIVQEAVDSEGELNDATGQSEKENTRDGHSPDQEHISINMPTNKGYASLRIRKLPTGLVFGRGRHKKDYESLAPFKFHCSTCSFRSKRKSHYLKHINIHTKKSLPVLQCAQCSFTTIRLSHLRRHQLSHSEKVFTCKVCSYRTDDIKRLNRHHRIKHVTAPPGPQVNVIYQCETCEYKTLKSHQYYRHLRCHASLLGDTASQPCTSYQCPLCPYKTQRKEHYSRHVANVHTDRRPYLCDLCGKAFKRQDALRQHKVIHQDKLSRPLRYACQVCLKGFRSHAHLMEHRTIHTDERSYLCEICGAAFKTRSVQRKHVQTIHQNPRAYSCPSCDKRFNTKYALQRHLRTHNTPGMQTLALEIGEQLGDGTTVTVLPTVNGEAVIHQELPVGEVVTGDETTAVVTIDGTTGTVRQLPQTTYIQTNEETTALLYLTSLPPY